MVKIGVAKYGLLVYAGVIVHTQGDTLSRFEINDVMSVSCTGKSGQCIAMATHHT